MHCAQNVVHVCTFANTVQPSMSVLCFLKVNSFEEYVELKENNLSNAHTISPLSISGSRWHASISNLPAHGPVFVESGVSGADLGVLPLSVQSKYMCHWATACNQICLYSLWDSFLHCPSGWETSLLSPWWLGWWAVCSTHSRPALNTRTAALSGKDGWTMTGRHEEEEEGRSGGGAGTAGTVNGDWVNEAAVAGKFDESRVKKASDLARLVDGTVAEYDAAGDDDLPICGAGCGLVLSEADGGSVIAVAGGGLESAKGYLVTAAPAGTQVMVQLADDLETVVLCDSS